MQHLDEGTIHSWLDGALNADKAARAGAHVAECPECAAAVAEARGFIAASSRILTALDNAPRGVIPAAVPVKRVYPLVWRVAATVLVVAAGTLVVVQNRESGQPLKAVSENQATALQEAAPDTDLDAATQSAGAAQKAAVGAEAGGSANATVSEAPLSRASTAPPLEKAATANTRRGTTTGQTKALADGISVPADQAATRSEFSAAAAAPTPAAPTASPSRAAGVAAMDAAPRTELLKVVGSPRQIGAKITLYEVAPGDTVTLMESMPVALNSVVVTGAAEARMAPQATGKNMAPPATARADAASRDAQQGRRTGEVAAVAPAVSAAPPTAQMGAGMTLRTIKWIDSATGNTLALTGRLPEARLQEIRITIERERAAAAKKIP